MKLPAVAIAAPFACGILLGLSHFLSSRAADPFLLAVIAGTVFLLLISGVAVLWILNTPESTPERNRAVWVAAAVSLVTWIGLGVLAGCLVEQPLPAEHIVTRFATHQIPQKTPLRWHGMLRGEPDRLPWGYGLEVDLSGVDSAEGYLPVRGGMRLVLPGERKTRFSRSCTRVTKFRF